MRKKIKKNRFSLSEVDPQDQEHTGEPHDVAQRKRHLLHIVLASAIMVVGITIAILFTTIYRKPDSPDSQPGSIISDLLPQGSTGEEREDDVISDNDELAKAVRAFSDGRYPAARTLLLEIVESDAHDRTKAEALVYLGRIERNHDNISRAISAFTRALKYNRKNHTAHIELAKAYGGRNDFDKALDHIDKALSIQKGNSDIHLIKGNLLFRQQKYAGAQESYTEAITIDGDNGHAYYNRALTHIKRGDTFAAIEDLKRAAASGTDRISYLSYSRLGSLFLQNNDIDAAVKYLKLAVSSGDPSPDDIFNLGLAHLSRGDKDEAVDYFQQAEAEGSEDIELISRLADIYAESYDNYTKGIELYQRLAEEKSGNTEILLKLGELFYKDKDYNSALAYFRRVADQEGASHRARRAYLYMGAIYDENQRYADAIDAYKNAIDIDPTDDSAYFNMGIAYRNSNDTVQAIESWEKAYQLNPDNPRPLIAAADLLYEKGYLDEAVQKYTNIIEKWPSNAEALFSLATIYNKKENRGSAQKYYTRVIDLDTDDELTKKSLINLALLQIDEESAAEDPDEISTAVSHIKKALMIAPGDREALYALGIIYYKKELYERAIETFYQVVKASNDPEETARAYNNIGKSYFQMNEYQKAVRAFSRGIEQDPSNEELRINRRSASRKYEQDLGI